MSAGRRLVRALESAARAAGLALRIEAVSERPWASVTFAGARHVLTLDEDFSPAFAAWLAALPSADLILPGYVVADLSVERDAAGVRLTVLTLEIG